MKIDLKTLGLALILAIILIGIVILLFLWPDTIGIAIGVIALIVVCYNIVDVVRNNPDLWD